MFSAREWNQLKELSLVLAPFFEITTLTEGEKSVTISMVIPSALDLNTDFLKAEKTQMHCWSLVKARQQTLEKRFSGIYTKTNMAKAIQHQSIACAFCPATKHTRSAAQPRIQVL